MNHCEEMLKEDIESEESYQRAVYKATIITITVVIISLFLYIMVTS